MGVAFVIRNLKFSPSSGCSYPVQPLSAPDSSLISTPWMPRAYENAKKEAALRSLQSSLDDMHT